MNFRNTWSPVGNDIWVGLGGVVFLNEVILTRVGFEAKTPGAIKNVIFISCCSRYKKLLLDWRHGSVDKNSCCSCRGPVLVPSTHLVGHNLLYSSFRGSHTFFWPPWAHMQALLIYECSQNTLKVLNLAFCQNKPQNYKQHNLKMARNFSLMLPVISIEYLD